MKNKMLGCLISEYELNAITGYNRVFSKELEVESLHEMKEQDFLHEMRVQGLLIVEIVKEWRGILALNVLSKRILKSPRMMGVLLDRVRHKS